MPAPERMCWFCKHVAFDPGSPDWSELTPGEDWELRCKKGHYYLDSHEEHVTLDMFRRAIETARTCEDFEAKPPGAEI